jgi:hypothetical protein
MQRICPKCGSTSVVTFDADEDWCTQCKSRFPGLSIPCHCAQITRLNSELSQLRTAHDAAVEELSKAKRSECPHGACDSLKGEIGALRAERDAAVEDAKKCRRDAQELFGALEEMVALWGRVHGFVIPLGRPTVNAAKKALAAIPSPPNGCCEWTNAGKPYENLWYSECGVTAMRIEPEGATCPCGKPISIKAEEWKP